MKEKEENDKQNEIPKTKMKYKIIKKASKLTNERSTTYNLEFASSYYISRHKASLFSLSFYNSSYFLIIILSLS